MKAMILAAGLGTRLKPYTNNIPKALVKINNRTLLEHVIFNLKNQGVKEIIINVHHYAEKIINYVEKKNQFEIHIEFSVEPELLDTGGGLKKAAWFFNDQCPFIVHNVDVLSGLNIREMLKFHEQSNALVTLAVRQRNTSRYFLFDENKRLSGWQNISKGEQQIIGNQQKKLLPYSFMGIHIISPQIFNTFPQNEKFSIVKFYLKIAEKKIISGFQADKYFWLDCGKPENLKQAKKFV